MRAALLLVLVTACAGSIGGDDGTNPGSGSDPGSGSSGPASAHEFCVTETNRYRTDNGRAPVARSTELEQFADTGAMIDFSGSPHDHFKQTNGGGIAFAENECPHWGLAAQGGGDMNTLVAACIAAFVSEGPGGGHYENLMGNYAKLGCGIFQSGGDVTLVQDYGP